MRWMCNMDEVDVQLDRCQAKVHDAIEASSRAHEPKSYIMTRSREAPASSVVHSPTAVSSKEREYSYGQGRTGASTRHESWISCTLRQSGTSNTARHFLNKSSRAPAASPDRLRGLLSVRDLPLPGPQARPPLPGTIQQQYLDGSYQQ